MDLIRLQQNLRPLTSGGYQPSLLESRYFSEYALDLEKQLPDVRHNFGYIDSHNYRIACHLYLKKPAQGSVFILHGYFDHSGYFNHVIRFFLEKNYNVFIYDLPGHGLSTGKPASIPDFSMYSQILEDLQNYCRNSLLKPWCGFGQSTGSAILTDFLMEKVSHNQPVPFEKLILSAPLVRPKLWHINRLQLCVMKFFTRQIPRKFTNNSRDKAFLRKAHNDPLSAKMLSIEWLLAMDRWIRRIESSRHIIPLTTVIIQGTHDGTVDGKYNIPKLQQIYQNTQVLWLENARHHLPNEIEETRRQYFSWLNTYL